MTRHIHVHVHGNLVRTSDDWKKWNEEHRGRNAYHKRQAAHHAEKLKGFGNPEAMRKQAPSEHAKYEAHQAAAHSHMKASQHYEEAIRHGENKTTGLRDKHKETAEGHAKEAQEHEKRTGEKDPHGEEREADRPTPKDPNRSTPLRHSIAHKEMVARVKKSMGKDKHVYVDAGMPDIEFSLKQPQPSASAKANAGKPQTEKTAKSPTAEQVDPADPHGVGTGAPKRPPLKAARSVEVMNQIDDHVRKEDWKSLKGMKFEGCHPLVEKYRDDLVEFENKREKPAKK